MQQYYKALGLLYLKSPLERNIDALQRKNLEVKIKYSIFFIYYNLALISCDKMLDARNKGLLDILNLLAHPQEFVLIQTNFKSIFQIQHKVKYQCFWITLHLKNNLSILSTFFILDNTLSHISLWFLCIVFFRKRYQFFKNK